MNQHEKRMYPEVMSERETLQALCTGGYRGLARYGDGDFAVMRGQQDRYQKWDPSLAHALARSLGQPAKGVLNAIVPPPRDCNQLANQRWICYEEANAGIIGFLPRIMFGSASISRMDSCPQLHTPEWWLEVSQLWTDQNVTLIRGSDRSLTAAQLISSPGSPESVTEIMSDFRNSWDKFEELEKKANDTANEIVLLCTGLVARPLVHTLVGAGHKAYDLGHLGLWFREGLPKPPEECRP
jgi:Glycosyltransferase GT-D fold